LTTTTMHQQRHQHLTNARTTTSTCMWYQSGHKPSTFRV